MFEHFIGLIYVSNTLGIIPIISPQIKKFINHETILFLTFRIYRKF